MKLLDALRARWHAHAQVVETIEALRTEVRALADKVPSKPATYQGLEAVKRDLQAIAARLKKGEEVAQHLHQEQRALRMLVENGAASRRDDVTLSTGHVPLELDEAEAPTPPLADMPATMASLDACPVCGETARTLVCEFNKLILLEVEIAEAMRRYDYCLCHGCGIVYASLRPTGETFAALFDRFDDNLGRAGRNQKRNLLLSPGRLSDADRAVLVSRLAAGTLVSEHLEMGPRDYFPQIHRDRLAASMHVEVIGSVAPPRGGRALEIRSRYGAIAAALRRLYDMDAFAMPMTEAQQFIIEHAYGLTASAMIDFEDFRIPYEGSFDLIVANHMMTHTLRPGAFLDELRRKLTPTGHLYLYNEPDEAEFLEGNPSIINTMNPFHMQTFDRRSLARALAVHGFEVVFVGRDEGNLIVLARAATPSPQRMPDEEREARLSGYVRARDSAILRIPTRERWRFRDEWDQVVKRGLRAGVAAFDEHARLHAVRTKTEAAEDEPQA